MRILNSRRLLFVVVAAGQLCIGGLARSAAVKRSPAVAYPTFGVAFEHPDGWVEQMRDKPGTIGMWTSPGATAADPKIMIQVEGSTPSVPSAEKTAQGLAQNFGGEVLKQTIMLDGEKAWRVRSEKHDAALHPVEAVVAMHGPYVYMIMGGVTDGNSCQAEIERIRRTWKWINWEPPSKHLSFRKEPISALGDKMEINFPQLMRLDSNDDPEHVLDLSLPNLHRNAPDFLLLAQLVDRKPNQSFAELKAGFLAGLAQKLKLNPAPTWHERPSRKGVPAAVIMPVIDIDGAAIGQQGMVHFAYALVELSPKQVVLINFTLAADSEQERKAYVPIMDQILDSIRSEPGGATGKPAAR